MIEALAADGADQAFDVRILPGRARGDTHLVDTEAAHTAPKSFPVYVVTVTQQVPGRGVEGKGLDYLLCRPLGRGVSGDVEVDNLAAFVSQHQEHVEDLKAGCGDGEEIDGHELFDMIVEEGPPSLGRWLLVPNHVLGDRGLGDLDAKHLKFPMQTRRTPQGILLGWTGAESALVPLVIPVVGRHGFVAIAISNRAEIPADANAPRCPP